VAIPVPPIILESSGVMREGSNAISNGFLCAVALGHDESNLDSGKHFLLNEKNARRAIPYFTRVTQSDWVTESGAEEAAALLRDAKKQLGTRPS
jgi:hypothetical protein